jgi:hypothetical protein
MSDTPVEQRWRVLFTPRWLSWHLFAVVAFAGLLWLGDWQFRRAMAGNSLSWAYTFEWPVFAIFGAVFWVKTVRDELRPAKPAQQLRIVLPASVGVGSGTERVEVTDGEQTEQEQDDSETDVELAEYNAYLAVLGKRVEGRGTGHGPR